MNHAGKPLTFAAMLVRAQRRFNALGQAFPNTRPAPVVQAWPTAARQEAQAGPGRLLSPDTQRSFAV